MKGTELYGSDFYAWTQQTAEALEQGRVDDVDLCQVAEEIRDMGKSERHALESHLERILVHLLKIEHQPSRHTRSWDLSIAESRERIQSLLEESPSLRPKLRPSMLRAYRTARLVAARQTFLPLEQFPEQCTFSLEDVLGKSES